MSEITRADYRAITDTAYDLHARINNLMKRTAGAGDPAWQELYDLMQLMNVVAGTASRYAARAGLPREPVDYRPGVSLPHALEWDF